MVRSLFAKPACVVLAVCMYSIALSAQETPKIVNGGIVNGKAVSLPMPEYPESAKAMKVSGVVAVNIVIDEFGNVVSAQSEINDQRERRNVDGTKLDPLPADPTLRDAAEKAALLAKFSPTQLDGQPVRIKGVIVYSFASDKAYYVTHSAPDLSKINGGVLNGKAISLPKPEYPPAAVAVRAEGAVLIQVTVDEEGNVIDAKAISGHPLLRQAAEIAAGEAKFSPTFQSGKAVKIIGVLTFDFVLPKQTDQ